MTLLIPIRTVSEANQREHWAKKHRRNKDQQEAVAYALLARWRFLPKPPVVVVLRRLGPRLLDSDNLAGSFKHVQDAVARFLGVDDGDVKAVRWLYTQEKSALYAVRISFAPENL